ncbi:hypothetical protein ATM17_40235 (plasmid) [Sphingopyxis macrogoltabida]|uniref:Uncharacterized protein n=1 Tax=Sphingopyxis macrogoltabida TaxID=33050 RepID=A0AAC9FHV8_SPHMC|nr:hypothetical protein ATM17_40235 [Sphingopyxis macrogoltabida]
MYLTLVFRNTFPCDGDFVKPIVREQPLAEAVDFVRVVGQTLVLTVLCDRVHYFQGVVIVWVASVKVV